MTPAIATAVAGLITAVAGLVTAIAAHVRLSSHSAQQPYDGHNPQGMA